MELKFTWNQIGVAVEAIGADGDWHMITQLKYGPVSLDVVRTIGSYKRELERVGYRVTDKPSGPDAMFCSVKWVKEGTE